MSLLTTVRAWRRTACAFTAFVVLTAALFIFGGEQSAEANASGSTPAAVGVGTTFPGTGTGAIPDGNSGTPPQFGTPLVVSFNVSGIEAPITNVSVDFTATHSWVGDVEVVLTAPGGSPSIPIVSRIGVTTLTGFGDSSNYGGTYVFNDAAMGTNIWTVATNAACGDTCTVTAATYRSTAAGGAGQTNPPPVTNITATFAGLSTAQANGTWTLRFRDAAQADTGSVSAANLTITGTAGPTGPVKNDFDGDGKSDYAVTRNTVSLSSGEEVLMNNAVGAKRGEVFRQVSADNLGTAPGDSRVWWVNNSGNNSATVVGLGTGGTGELFVPADYDGDAKADIAVWRSEGGTAYYFIFNSATSTLSTVEFGLAGDNPTVTGDYDGDGKADPAVFRCPSFPPGGQCNFYYRGSDNNPGNNITYVPWGNNVPSDVFPNRGDFDGDGKFDFVVQRVNPATVGQGQFVLLRSSDFGVEYINWGTSSSLVVPGDYDGDGKSDFMVVRVISGSLQWALQTRTGAQTYTNWGTTTVVGTTEFIAQSDYDGDGKTDIAVYRRDNANPNNCYYYVLRSSDGALQTYEWGASTDTPVNGWDVN